MSTQLPVSTSIKKGFYKEVIKPMLGDNDNA